MTAKTRTPLMPVDKVAYEPVMIALSKARALAWALEQAGANDGDTELGHALQSPNAPEETREWLHSAIADGLRKALDDIEARYRKLGTRGSLV